MPKSRTVVVAMIAGAFVLAAGLTLAQEEKVQTKEGEQAMTTVMPKPPAEHKDLEYFVGKWKETFEFSPDMMPPEGGKGTGVSTAEWVLDGWFLKVELDTEPSEMGHYKSVSYFWYDAKEETHRSWNINNMGEVEEGTSTYDADTKTWHMKSESSMMGQPVKGKSTIRLVSPTRMEWEWHTKGPGDDEYKLMMKGISERIES